MATSRAVGYVVTASVWNAVLSRLTDDGVTFSGNFNGGTVAGSTGSFSSTLAVTGAITGQSTITERGRSTPIGEWIAVSFSAGDFTANGGTDPTWTVDSGDVTTHRYMLVGKTLWLNLRVGATSIGGSPTELRVAIPGGFSANTTTSVATGYLNIAGTVYSGLAEGVGGASYVRIAKLDASAMATSTNNAYVYIMVPMEVA